MIAEVTRVWREQNGPEPFAFLKMAGRRHLVALLFPGKSAVPAWVAKAARDPRDDTRLSHTAAILRRAADQTAGTDLARALPQVISWTERPPLLIESALPGQTLISRLRAPLAREVIRSRTLLRAAFDWIVRFHQSGLSAASGDRTAQLLAPFGGTLPADLPSEARAAVGAAVARFPDSGPPLPASLCHGDYNPYNIVVGPSGLGVLDWEDAHDGVPLIDLCNLFTILVCYLPYQDPGQMAERFRAHFRDPRQAVARRELARDLCDATARLGFSPTQVNAYYPIHLAHTMTKWQGNRMRIERWQEVLTIYQHELNGRLIEP